MTDKTMDKRYQGVIRRRKSMKDGQNNGQKIPRGIIRRKSMKDRTNNGQKIPRGNKKA
jgi:hypothetical protein